ncbi:MAG: PD40 domain-containing protein [Nitrospirae bacterium]|nr:PD40 domain-containing protein [Nitrospirota bacterium]
MLPKSAKHEVASATTLLSTIDSDDVSDLSNFKALFSERGDAVAYRAKKDDQYQAVYNGRKSRLYQDVAHLSMSSDGSHFAHDLLENGRRRIVLDGREGKEFDDVWRPVFSPDGRHIAYTAQTALKYYIVVDDKVSKAAASSYSEVLAFSADSSKIAYIERDERSIENQKMFVIVSDLEFKKQSIKECRDDLLITNKDKTMIAAVTVSGNKQRVISFSFSQPDLVKEGPLYDSIDKLDYIENILFGSDSASLVYTAKRDGKSYIVLNGAEEELPMPDGLRWSPVIRPDGKGVGLIMAVGKERVFYEAFMKDDMKRKRYDEAAMPVYSDDSSQHAYCARRGKDIFIVVNGKEGPVFDYVVAPIFSPDGSRLVYRARKDNKRLLVVSDTNGKVIRQLPAYDMIFDTLFTADGKSVAYGVKDGNELWWKVEKL